MSAINEFLAALHRKCRFELPSYTEPGKYITESANQIQIIGRVPQQGTTMNMANWLLVMYGLFDRMNRPNVGWKADISKSYFARNGKVVFAWRIILQGENVKNFLPEIIQVVNGSPVSNKAEVEEISLNVRGDRNAGANGKGAGYSGKVAVGPMAVANRMRGG